MSANGLHAALLRPVVIQILRAAGFNNAKASVIDTVTDLAARYLLLLGETTARAAFNNHNTYVPTVQDVRMALLEAGALYPQMTVLEEEAKGFEIVDDEVVPFEDLRGIEAFVNWARGTVNKDIRRIAGVSAVGKDLTDINLLDEGEDFLMAMKKKHSKTGDDSRYHGTILSKDAENQAVTIAGGEVMSLRDWRARVRASHDSLQPTTSAPSTPATSGISSAPDTPFNEDEDDAI